MTRSRRIWLAALGLCGLVALGGIAGQPQRARPADAEIGGRPEDPSAAIERGLAFARMLEARFLNAQQRLENGEDPRVVGEGVRRLFERARRARDGANPFRDEAPPELSDEQRADVLSFAREKLPNLTESMEKLAALGGARGEQFMNGFASRVYPHMISFERDPELTTLRLDELRAAIEVRQAAWAFRQDPDTLDRLREAIGAQFDARLAVERLQIERFRQRLTEQAERLDARRGERDDVVDLELRRLLEGGPPRRPFRDGDGENRRRWRGPDRGEF